MKKIYFTHYLPLILWMAVIFAFSANPKPYSALPQSWSEPSSSNPVGPSSDEILGRFLHVGEYIVLAILVSRMSLLGKRNNAGLIMVVIGLSGLYALSDEFHQSFVPGRSAQWSDLLLDLIGILIGVLVFKIWQRTRANKSLANG